MLKMTILALTLTCSALGQTVELTTGERHTGKIGSISNNRMKFRDTSGRVMQFELRRIRFSIDDQHKITRYAAQYVSGPMSAQQRSMLSKLKLGQPLPPYEYQLLTKDCTEELIKELKGLSGSEKKEQRIGAICSLGSAGLKESCVRALDAALEDEDPEVRRAAIQSMMNETSAAALKAGNQGARVESGLTTKDKKARLGFAWIGVRLGSKKALAALVPYVKDKDHHIREEVAMLLAEHGNAAGLSTLHLMLRRKESPALKANRDAPESVLKTIMAADHREKLAVCHLLGKLASKKSTSTLKKAAKSKDKDIATAAQAALSNLLAKKKDTTNKNG